MIRWSYVLPRLLVIVAVLGFVAFALEPIVQVGDIRIDWDDLNRDLCPELGVCRPIDRTHATALDQLEIRVDPEPSGVDQVMTGWANVTGEGFVANLFFTSGTVHGRRS